MCMCGGGGCLERMWVSAAAARTTSLTMLFGKVPGTAQCVGGTPGASKDAKPSALTHIGEVSCERRSRAGLVSNAGLGRAPGAAAHIVLAST